MCEGEGNRQCVSGKERGKKIELRYVIKFTEKNNIYLILPIKNYSVDPVDANNLKPYLE